LLVSTKQALPMMHGLNLRPSSPPLGYFEMPSKT
jgi:hypothetical protein